MKTSKMCVLGSVFAACLAAGAETPDRFIRYAEATGVQAVDVGVRGRYGTKMEASIEWTALADMSILDAREDPNTHSRIYFAHSGNNGPITIGYGTYSWTTRGSGDSRRNCYWEIGRTYKVETEFAVTNEIVTTETVVTNLVEDLETGETNEVVETVTTVTTNDISKISYKIDGLGVSFSGLDRDLVDTGRNLYLFACNEGTPNYKAKARCYGMKIWQDDANGVRQLVRDFRPCMKNGRVGLYDSVSQTIFYSFTGTDLVYDANEDVPDEFVDYVEAHGNTYVDTEVIGRSGTSCEADMEWLMLTASGDFAFLDVRGTYGADDRFMLIHSFARKMNVGYGKFKNNVNGAREFSLGTRYTITSDLRAGSQTLVVNGETVYSATEAESYNTGRHLYLFANNRAGTVENYGHARLYRLKIWQDGVLVRDFLPCRKHGIPALYDDVDKRIFYAEQSQLTASPFDPTVAGSPDYFTEYLQANGDNYLDTGVRGRAGTRAAGEFSWTQMRGMPDEQNRYLEDAISRHERTYLGAVNGGDRFYLLHEANTQIWSGYGMQRIYPERVVTNYVETVTTNLDETVTTNLVEVVSTNRFYMAAGHKYSFDVSYAAGSQTVELDDDRILDATSEASIDTGSGIYLFAVNNNGKPLYEAPARCYGLKLWQDGTLVRDFKPCVKDGKGLLWDEVTQTLYRPFHHVPATLDNVGAIVDIGGAKPVSYLDYIETDGTQYIDTEILGRDGTAAEFEMAWLVSGGDESFLGSRTSGSTDSRFFFWQKNNGRFYYGYNSVCYPDKNDPTRFASSNNNKISVAAGQTYHVNASFAAGAQRVTIDGNLAANHTQSSAVAAEHPLYLFAANFGGTPLYFGRCRFRWLKIWQDGELVRNFRPVLLDSGFAALWDSVSERVFWPNAPFSALGPVTRKFNSSTVITVR